jgi:hypothetical protein
VIRDAYLILVVACSAGAATTDGADTSPRRTVATPGPGPALAAALCGDSPLASCPLQSWMNASLAPTFRRKDFVRLEAAFRDLAGLGPEGWSDWPQLAEAGATAARAQLIDDVRAACSACHSRFRTRYRAELRARPLPDSRGER